MLDIYFIQCRHDVFFRELFCLSDDKLSNYVCMVTHTCLSNNLDNDGVWTNQDTIQIVTDVITYTADHDCDWG